MPESPFQPAAIEGHESAPQSLPVYVYAIVPEDLSQPVFLTSWGEEISISGLPARLRGNETQEFMPTQISHDAINRKSDFNRHSFQVTAMFSTAGLPSYFLTTPTTPISVEIIRIAKGTFDGNAVAEWGVDTYVVQSGLIQSVTLKGELVTVSCVPRAFHMESGVPRLWFSRSCQWPLYGRGCELDGDDFSWESAILSFDRQSRTVIVTGSSTVSVDDPNPPQILVDDPNPPKILVDDPSWPAGPQILVDDPNAPQILVDDPNPPQVALPAIPDYFTGGYLIHNQSGGKFTIVNGDSSSGDTVLRLGHWSGELKINDQLKLFAGCNRSVSDCTVKFKNSANYGGFSRLPDRNPTTDGA